MSLYIHYQLPWISIWWIQLPFEPEMPCDGASGVKTVVVQIGNSDNKLRQADWARFVQRVGALVREHAGTIHFFGGPENWATWQKVCWVFDGEESRMMNFKSRLAELRKEFLQDSAAVTLGETEFV